MTQDMGYIDLCACKECNKFGRKRFEHFSVSLALRWVAENCPSKRVNLWVDSERLIADSQSRFMVEANRYECPFLKTLDEDICALSMALDVVAKGFADELTSDKATGRSKKRTV